MPSTSTSPAIKNRAEKKKALELDFELVSFLGGQHQCYSDIWDFQKQRLSEIVAGQAPETLIFCEHEEVITAGRRFSEKNILKVSSVPVYKIERGGDVTWHGPGQLVIYPLFHIQKFGGLHAFLRFWEEVVITFLSSYGLEAGRFGPTGVWVINAADERKKIASLGVSVRRWVSFHGLALNVSNDLSCFQKIRPCNFEASVMTSCQEQGLNLSTSEVKDSLLKIFQSNLSSWSML